MDDAFIIPKCTLHKAMMKRIMFLAEMTYYCRHLLSTTQQNTWSWRKSGF